MYRLQYKASEWSRPKQHDNQLSGYRLTGKDFVNEHDDGLKSAFWQETRSWWMHHALKQNASAALQCYAVEV